MLDLFGELNAAQQDALAFFPRLQLHVALGEATQRAQPQPIPVVALRVLAVLLAMVQQLHSTAQLAQRVKISRAVPVARWAWSASIARCGVASLRSGRASCQQ